MRRNRLAIIMLLLAALLITACGVQKFTDVNAGVGSDPTPTAQQSTPTSESKGGDEDGKSIDVGTNVPGVLTVGFDQNFPPMGFVGDDGEFTGFDLELAAEVAKRLNLKLELQPIAWESKDMELSSKNIDCVWNGFTINGREDKYTWTKPYMANKQVFVVKADSGIETLSDLSGKAVAVQLDSSAEAALAERSELVKSFGDYIKAPDYNTALMDLASGAVDAVGMDLIVAQYQIEKRGDNFVVLEESIASENYGVGFLLGNEKLRDAIENTLMDMVKDGTMKKISEKWFGEDITTLGK